MWERTDEAYQCLSYTWALPFSESVLDNRTSETGNNITVGSAVSNEITVNGARLNVGANLYHFLEKYTDMPIWIDAICINQEDDLEKSSQVERMADVHAGADAMLLWLGD
ncbi:hypothetical protein EK21DRAFT_73498, partial [Setomelanomma holmii]